MKLINSVLLTVDGETTQRDLNSKAIVRLSLGVGSGDHIGSLPGPRKRKEDSIGREQLTQRLEG